MATLKKIQISGIRSFCPYEQHELKFTSPVTLILGENGCGKTTILESVKYACCAEPPGGTNKGQSFVNDPKMSGLSSTEGRIELELLDSENNKVTVSRVVEVRQTDKSMKFNKRSSALKKGQEPIISGSQKVTNEVCKLMNVSPAMLNYVIFCHQENSLWPLDEGKTLKETFDTIFDGQKYDECSELFQKHLTQKTNGIELLTEKLAHCKGKMDQAEESNRDLQDKENKLERFDEEIKTNNAELGTVKTRMEEIFELERNLADLERELVMKREQKNGVIKEQNTIKEGLAFEFEGTDQELRAKLDFFEHDRQGDENLVAVLEKYKTETDNNHREVAEVIQATQIELGKLKEQKNQFENKCLERSKLFGLRNLKDFETTNGARAALDALTTEMERQQLCLDTLRNEKEEEQKELQNVIDKARESSVTTTQNILSNEREVKECEKKVNEFSEELISISSSDVSLGDIQKRIDTIDSTVYNLNMTFKETEESQKLEDYKKDIQTIENIQKSLDGEYRILQQNNVIEGAIESVKCLMLEKRKEIDRIKLEHSDNFKELFGGAIPSERNLKEQVLRKQRNADCAVKNLEDEITTKGKEVTTLEVQRTNKLERIAIYEKDLIIVRDRISQVCSGRDFNDALKTSFERKERLRIDKERYGSVRIIYGQFIQKFEEATPCCPVCETDFSHKGGVVAKIVSTLKSEVDRVPEQLRKVESDLQKEEALYGKLQQLKLVNEDVELLEKEKLPKSRQTLGEIEQKLNDDREELDGLKISLNEWSRILEVASTVMSDVGSLDQNLSDVEKSQRTVDNLKLTMVEVPSKKSRKEVEEEIDLLKFAVSELRDKVDSTTRNINNHKDRIQQLLQERKEVVEKQMRLKETVQNRPNLEAQKRKFSEKVTTLKEETSSLKIRLNREKDDLKRAVENKESKGRKSKQEVEVQREKITGCHKIFQEISKLQGEIEDYLENEIDAKLAATEQKLKECRNKEAAFEITKSKILDTIAQKQEDLAKEKLRLMTLQSNVRLREKKICEAQLEIEIQHLITRVGGFDDLREEKRRLELKREDLERQINSRLGEKTGLLESIRGLRQELNKPEIKNAYSNYMAKFYELKVRESVIDDIRNLIKALEKAVLAFHTSKMVQINRTLRKLWRDTYTGNDIDHIEIKAVFAESNAKRRAYNYKVVQIKGDIELDMRGRCSAGQKVLACFLIRMALAETLSSSCGILALDEPTTNLDRANVLSLSDTLARVISQRRDEKTFQLVVITHDEEFLKSLTRTQAVDFYYKIQRDNDGYSEINRETVL